MAFHILRTRQHLVPLYRARALFPEATFEAGDPRSGPVGLLAPLVTVNFRPLDAGVGMINPKWPTREQLNHSGATVLQSHGPRRMDDRQVLRGIVTLSHHGLHWRDTPSRYEPCKSRCGCWERWIGAVAFACMM
jgi:hypothetical protein